MLCQPRPVAVGMDARGVGKAEVQRLVETDPRPGGLLHAMLARGTLPSLGFASRVQPVAQPLAPLRAPAVGVQRVAISPAGGRTAAASSSADAIVATASSSSSGAVLGLINSAKKRIRNSLSTLFRGPHPCLDEVAEEVQTPGKPSSGRKGSYRKESPASEKPQQPTTVTGCVNAPLNTNKGLSRHNSGDSGAGAANAATGALPVGLHKQTTPVKSLPASSVFSSPSASSFPQQSGTPSDDKQSAAIWAAESARSTGPAISPSAADAARIAASLFQDPPQQKGVVRGQKRKRKAPPPKVPLFSPPPKEQPTSTPSLLKRVPLPQKRIEDNYEISDKEDTDDEGIEEPDRSMKPVPEWCDGFQDTVLSQADVEPDCIFGRVPNCDLDVIFPDRMYRALSREPRKRPRGSSCRWDKDMLTTQEIAKYARKMGQCRRWSKLCRPPALKGRAGVSANAVAPTTQL